MPASTLPQPPTTLLPTAAVYLPAFTGVRAVAAYLVYLHHFNLFDAGPGFEGWIENVVREFHMGVPIFFVLSGFLIALRYIGTAQMTRPWWRRYLRNRMARIYPIYFLLTTLAFADIWFQNGTFSPKIWLLNILFLRGFFTEALFSGVAQGWTLTVEECFYLSAPLIFLLTRRRSWRLWLLPPLLLGLGLLLVAVLGPQPLHGLFNSVPFMLRYTFFGRATEFFVGIQLALWFRQGRLIVRSDGMRTGAGLLAIGAIVLLLKELHGPDYLRQDHLVGIVLNNLLLPVAIALWFTGLLTEQTTFRRLLSSRPMQVLGRSSYVFYLIHMGTPHEFITRFITAQPVLIFLLLIGSAIGLHYLVEEPLNRWLRTVRRSGQRAAAGGGIG